MQDACKFQGWFCPIFPCILELKKCDSVQLCPSTTKHSDLSRVCRSSDNRPTVPTISLSLAKGRLKSHNLMLKVNTRRKGLGEYWSDLEIYQLIQTVLFKGVCRGGGGGWGNIGGKAGLLILEKLLICSLLAVRTLIMPIVVLVPLRPEWMSLLRNSFLLRSKWRRSHQKRPDTENETSACWLTSDSVQLYFCWLHIILLMSGLLFVSCWCNVEFDF